MDAQRPLVSVIVTVYRRLTFLPQALDSIRLQHFADYEVIVADDSGTGATRDICASFFDQSRLRVLANPKTLGIAASLRRALSEARGRYVTILNDDDVWEPEFLARLVPALEGDAGRVLAFSDHWIVREDGQIDLETSARTSARFGRAGLTEGEIADPKDLVLRRNGVPLAMASLFRADSVDRSLLVPEVAGAYDFWISCLLAATGGAFYYVPDRLTRYRSHAGMETARRSPGKTQCLVFIFSALLEKNYFPEFTRFLQGRLARALVAAGREYLAFDQVAEARRLFVRSFRTARDWRPVAAYALTLLPAGMRRSADT